MKKMSIILPAIVLIGIGFYFMKQRGVSPISEGTTALETTPSAETAGVKPSEKSPGKTLDAHEPPKQSCFAFEYRHTDEAKSKDIEEFLDFTNAFPVLHAGVNAKSICVRVNQKPVPFQLVKDKHKKEEIMIGSVVGPESVIRVSYCVGKASCMEACPVAKKRFMDDMMSGALDDDANVSDDVKSKAKELRALASENKGLNDHSVMRNWTTLKKQEWACKK